jgi:hypothetical protein
MITRHAAFNLRFAGFSIFHPFPFVIEVVAKRAASWTATNSGLSNKSPGLVSVAAIAIASSRHNLAAVRTHLLAVATDHPESCMEFRSDSSALCSNLRFQSSRLNDMFNPYFLKLAAMGQPWYRASTI